MGSLMSVEIMVLQMTRGQMAVLKCQRQSAYGYSNGQQSQSGYQNGLVHEYL